MATPNLPIAPIPTPLLSLVSDSYFSESQWKTLFAMVDAAIPPIVVENTMTDKRNQLRVSQKQYEDAFASTQAAMIAPPDLDRFKEYLGSRKSDSPRFVQQIKRTLANLPDVQKRSLGGLLSLLSSRVGSFFLTGYCTPVEDMALHVRHAILQSWLSSRISLLPMAAKAFISMSQHAFSQADPLYHQLIGYTDHPANYKPGPTFDFNFLQFAAGAEPVVINTDVVIVGSGCGGGVCAKVLAEAGHDVLVVDKGYYFPPSQLPMTQPSGLANLYENAGFLGSDDASVNLIAGSCWGGGGTVNWSVALEPQPFVRKEWADQGLPLFTSAEYQDSIDRVSDFMGVSDAHVRHNHGSQLIINGARKLGWKAKNCPQNTGQEDHYCGRCHLGCESAGKKGPAVSWLPAASEAGAKFMEGFKVSEVIFDKSDGVQKAIGVKGVWTGRDENGQLATPITSRVQRTVRIEAKKVIVAAGSLQSPLLLLRSGLKNPHIGKHLHVHPTQYVMARFDKDIQPWEGSAITSVCSEFENLDGNGHGVKLETVCMVPYITITSLPWYSGLDFKLNALKLRNMNGFISLARDRDTGRVFPDPVTGGPRVDYTPSTLDRASMLAGAIALAKICYVEGAQEIISFVTGVPPFTPSPGPSPGNRSVDDPDFAAWLAAVEKAGSKAAAAPVGSAHQMGTCRMSSSAAVGVVDPRGRTWEAEDLYVADASVFPSASGVNPMITNMAIADCIARGISKELSVS
ncbi:long chain fatty alcohol oxidase [Xylariales sp. PMI_506]|nr:long chain fatty alcohol oxidase [Xylariales sp. PMI_506]